MSEVGGVSPTRKLHSFRSCVRASEAVCSRGTGLRCVVASVAGLRCVVFRALPFAVIVNRCHIAANRLYIVSHCFSLLPAAFPLLPAAFRLNKMQFNAAKAGVPMGPACLYVS